ncbi:hypothetical protein BO71DRAFT_400781 [Aspergillus ellipticus CBS 707.79]|uniref:Uncharacterized protein n=1 Tax=Aspergillus ellipticus CBS 707.79 TaxID=1448320 RepID=A0A319D486_9EURO|nr:hypothetical protein BO71DRAFT_400781 [Aspergillus ellipticus CBS 707.79]
MPWRNSRHRTPQNGGKQKNGKRLDVSQWQFHDTDISKHMPRLPQSLKGSNHNFIFRILCSTPEDRHPTSRQEIAEDLHTPPIPPQKSNHRSLTPGSSQNEPTGRVRAVRKSSNGFHHSDDREELTDSLHSMFRAKKNLHHPENYHHLEQCDFIYDIAILTSSNDLLRRRMLVDFETEVNVMDDDIYRRMNVRMQPYYGPAITVLGRSDVKPLGKVQATWSIYGRGKSYSTEFYIIRWASFDVLLGKTSVRELGLYRADPGIATRLRSASQQ